MTPIDWDKIEYFEPEEFQHPELLRREMIEKLDELRFLVGFPLKITSSYRTPEHNESVGGVKDSAHLVDPVDGKYSGIDISTGPIGAAGVFQLVRQCYAVGFSRIGVYSAHIHLDIEHRLPQQVMWVGKDS